MSRSRKPHEMRKPPGESPTQKRRRLRKMGLVQRPTKASGEVFVTGGRCFHSTWCSAVNGSWMSGADDPIKTVPLQVALNLGKITCTVCEPNAEPEWTDDAEKFGNITDYRLLIDREDYSAFRLWAQENNYGDSAYAFRKLLKLSGIVQ